MSEPTTTDSTKPGTTGDPADPVDVVVVGGGPAGLAAAIALARSRRSVVVVDGGLPRNAPAGGVHNFLSRDGVPPHELLAAGRAELIGFGGRVLAGEATSAARADEGFTVALAGGGQRTGRRLLVTTGLVDELPDLPGVRERWGRDVVHCPYCHGWEVRDQPIGVIGLGPLSFHQATLFRQLTDDLVFFSHAAPPLTDEQVEQFAARRVRVVPGRVAGLQVEDDRIVGVRLEDGTVVPRTAVAVGPRAVARSSVLSSLGLEPVAHPMGREVGEVIPAEAFGATSVPGVYVAGNVTDLAATVIAAAAAGLAAGAAINADLIAEDTQEAIAGLRG